MSLSPLSSQQTSRNQSTDFLLRIDRVGSFRIITESNVLLTGPGQQPAAGTLSLMGRLSSEHAWIYRRESGYWLEPGRGNVVRNGEGSRQELLSTGCWVSQRDSFQLDPDIKLNMSIPSKLSNSAIVNMEPKDRLVDRVDGIILMDRLLVLGPTEACHIFCRHWQTTAALVCRDHQLSFHSPLLSGRGDAGEKFDLSVEPLRYYGINEEIGLFLEPYPVSLTGFQA